MYGSMETAVTGQVSDDMWTCLPNYLLQQLDMTSYPALMLCGALVNWPNTALQGP